MRIPSVPALALAAAAAAAACVPINPLPRFGFDEASREEKTIADRMRAYSSRVEVYREFRTVFTARALYLAPAVRRAGADWEARTRLLDPGETRALMDKLVAPGESSVEFLVGFYAPDGNDNRLEAGGPWEVLLSLPDGRKLKASCLEVGGEEGAPFMRFLRWDLSWSRLYRVCFPLRPDDPALAGGMTLIIAGPPGSGEMRFLTPPPVPPAGPGPAPSNPPR